MWQLPTRLPISFHLRRIAGHPVKLQVRLQVSLALWPVWPHAGLPGAMVEPFPTQCPSLSVGGSCKQERHLEFCEASSVKISRILDFKHCFTQDKIDVLQEQRIPSSSSLTHRFVSCSLYISVESRWWWCTHTVTQGPRLMIAVLPSYSCNT